MSRSVSLMQQLVGAGVAIFTVSYLVCLALWIYVNEDVWED